jgi:pimeloyl-ACP methyl ester carboxylesterase
VKVEATPMKVPSDDGISIDYQVFGNDEPVMVFVHGWCCNQKYWEAQVPYFSQDHKVVTLDLAGHGNSGLGRTKWTIEAYGNDVRSVVKQLNLNHVILVGHSMGGTVIVEAARQMPERIAALVGVDTFTNVDNPIPPQQVEQMLEGLRANFTETMRNIVKISMFTPNSDAGLVEKVVTDMSASPPQVGLGSAEANISYNPGAALEGIKSPIFGINREGSPINLEKVKRHAPSFKIKFMPGVGHFVMMEQPDKFNQLLKEIIGSVPQQ